MPIRPYLLRVEITEQRAKSPEECCLSAMSPRVAAIWRARGLTLEQEELDPALPNPVVVSDSPIGGLKGGLTGSRWRGPSSEKTGLPAVSERPPGCLIVSRARGPAPT